MTIVAMSKKQVIEALRAEKLTSAEFVDGDGPAAKCAVCAVGAVVRACMPASAGGLSVNWAAWVLACHDQGKDRRLVALSKVYERAVGGRGGDPHGTLGATPRALERGRRAAIAYVKKRFPVEVDIDIGDAKPRRGMRVVAP